MVLSGNYGCRKANSFRYRTGCGDTKKYTEELPFDKYLSAEITLFLELCDKNNSSNINPAGDWSRTHENR